MQNSDALRYIFPPKLVFPTHIQASHMRTGDIPHGRRHHDSFSASGADYAGADHND